jgi:hypothetical protein
MIFATSRSLTEGGVVVSWHESVPRGGTQIFQPVFDAFRGFLPNEWSLYVECLDSVYDPLHVCKVLQHPAIALLSFSAIFPILPGHMAGAIDLNDEKIFPGWDIGMLKLRVEALCRSN